MPAKGSSKKTTANNVRQDSSLLVIDLYAGQGGFIAGFNKVEGWSHFAAVEIAEKHCTVLREVYPIISVLQQDVALVDWKRILSGVEIDCVIGGPPCQPFSQGNNRRNGWNDP
ncbi:MAG: DNA cytosine methyltransferase, partial [Chloroflexota bacterium]